MREWKVYLLCALGFALPLAVGYHLRYAVDTDACYQMNGRGGEGIGGASWWGDEWGGCEKGTLLTHTNRGTACCPRRF